jgi:farnesyl diphosphate synthase/geranylgeranyl diphosphate synthase type II
MVYSRQGIFVTETPVLVDLGADRDAIDAVLDRIGEEWVTGVPAQVSEAVQYSLRGPGKRLRGVLVSFAYRAAGGQGDATMLGAAVEIIHTYSLVHDDLPCMDDDDVRRGRPTTHKVYGTQTATLAGMAMIPLAARCLVAGATQMRLSTETTASTVDALMRAAGASGMVGGQWRDLEAEGEALTLDALEMVHRAKTGALVAAAARIGGCAAGASAHAQATLESYGADVGLAFQIVDDVLDMTSTTAQLGKTAGRDVALRKSTYPSLLGVQGAMAHARELVDSECQALDRAGLLTPELRYWAELVTTRTH